MVVLSTMYGQVEIPAWVEDWDSFRTWVHSEEVPENLKVHFINGQVWIEPMEEAFSHNRVKTSVVYTLEGICRADQLGLLFSDGLLFSNEDALLSTKPDVTFVAAETFQARRVTFSASSKSGAQATEMLGSPDLVVEIVSRSSEEKDLDYLMSAYHVAGVREYWLIDACRGTDVQFTIHRHGPKAFAAGRKAKGWSKSDVFGRAFRLVSREQFGLQDFVLETK